MYKKQLKIQKFICLVCIIAAALTFVYSLGMITDIQEALRSTMRNPMKPEQTKVEGSWIYYDMQPFNKQFTDIALIPILLACLLAIAIAIGAVLWGLAHRLEPSDSGSTGEQPGETVTTTVKPFIDGGFDDVMVFVHGTAYAH